MKYIVECAAEDITEYILVNADSEEEARNIVEQDDWRTGEIVNIYTE